MPAARPLRLRRPGGRRLHHRQRRGSRLSTTSPRWTRTPPALTAATVAATGSGVTLTFDENVVAAVGTLPSALADAFTVTVDGVDRGGHRRYHARPDPGHSRGRVRDSPGPDRHRQLRLLGRRHQRAPGRRKQRRRLVHHRRGRRSRGDQQLHRGVGEARERDGECGRDAASTLTFDKSPERRDDATQRTQFTVTAGGFEVRISAFLGSQQRRRQLR